MTRISDETNTGLAADIATMKVQVGALHSSVEEIKRSVNGDPAINAPSLRQSLQTLDATADALESRIDAIEQAAKAQENYLRGMTTVIKWLGGSTLVGLLGLIGTLSGLFGGKS